MIINIKVIRTSSFYIAQANVVKYSRTNEKSEKMEDKRIKRKKEGKKNSKR